MTLELKLQKIGDAVGLVLPAEALNHLKLEAGDTLSVTEGPEGVLHLAPMKDEVARQLEVGRELMKRYPNTLRELAK